MADKTLKSLNFGGADNYFPLPLVTAADNDKILSVVNGEWAAINVLEISGNYVWSKQFASSTVTEDTTSGTYTLTTADDARPSSEIEVSTSAPKYNSKTKKWEMAPSMTSTLTNADATVPSFSGNMYVRLTSAPNVWYLTTAINAEGSGPYIKSLAYSAKYTAAVDNSYVEYVTGETGADYPNGGWSDGALYMLKLVPIPCLTFDGNEDFTLKTANTTKNWDGTLEYSTDTKTWNTWDGTEISSAGSKLYLRGTGNTKITGDSLNYRFVFTGTNALKIACRGNIENLLDHATVSSGGHPTMAEYCYRDMFNGCTALTTAPELPATTLATSCYYNMFRGCASLTTAPALPATKLATSCYRYMFNGCTSLTTAPALPATTLANSCYESMFSGCISLATAPALPATTLANSCYRDMFNGCTSLTTAPALSATTLANYCYYGMFSDCASLTTAPELPATTLADSCYWSMFSGCTALTTAPELPATTLVTSCYRYMFNGCTSLTTAPSLPATTLSNYCYYGMFYSCKSLTTAPALPATTLAIYCYHSIFRGCTSLTTAPSLPATTLANNCYYGMFRDCIKIKLSTTQTGEYQTAYRIPKSGTGNTATNALKDMFTNTGGTFTGTPEINTTYYTSNTVV